MQELLDKLNELRVVDGKTPIKHWSGSEAELVTAIAKRAEAQMVEGRASKTDEELVAEFHARGGIVVQGREHSAKGVKGTNRQKLSAHRAGHLKKRHKKLREGHIPKPREPIGEDQFTLIELAAAVGDDGRMARSRARKSKEVESMAISRWVFHRKDWDRVGRLIWGERWKPSFNLNPDGT